MKNWIKQLVPATGQEWPAVAWAFGWFFMIMGGYMILRPIRESFGASLSDEINYLYFAVFFVMLVVVPIFGWLVSKVNRRLLVRIAFHFFALNIVIFGCVLFFLEQEQHLWVGRIYFVWVSVFNLFVVSLFWSVMADLFSAEQAKRLFGPIAAGATTGAIVGSAFTTWASTRLGIGVLMFVAAAMLELGLGFAAGLQRSTREWKKSVHPTSPEMNSPKPDKSSDGLWAGMLQVARSRYLILICVYLALTSACGAAIYLQMAIYVGENIADSAERTQYFASINFFVQAITLVLQLFVVGAVMRKLGVAVALIALPLVYLFCLGALGIWQSLMVFAIVDVLRRSFVYGMSVPAREVLFTVVGRQAKYKSKNFIDTVVFRGSDAASSSIFVWLGSFFQSLQTLNFVVLPLALVWAALGWRLGKSQVARQEQANNADSRN